MFVQSMDSSHVMLFEFVLPAHWFDVYEVTVPVKIGLSTSVLQRIMKVREKNQQVEWWFNDDDDALTIEFKSVEKPGEEKEYDKAFQMCIMDIDSEMLQIPDNEYAADLEFTTKSFMKMIAQINDFGDTLNIDATEERVYWKVGSGEYSVEVEVKMDDLENFSIEENAHVRSSFGVRYVKAISMFGRVSEKIRIGVTENVPIQFSYFLVDAKSEEGEDEKGEKPRIVFYLAPKVDENDE
jgi:proliferating cell nuclear antigen PCNA